MKEKLEELIKEIELKIDPNFNFELEHWDNGNYDDSYSYGREVEEQYIYRALLIKLKSIIE